MYRAWLNFLGNSTVQVDAANAEAVVRGRNPLLLHPDERIELVLHNRDALGRDRSYFTSHRILIKFAKGVGSKRVRYLSIPFASIQAFSVETVGKFDGDVRLKVWSGGMETFTKIDFAAGQIDVFGIQQYLNSKIYWVDKQGSEEYVCGEPPLESSKPSPFEKLMAWLGDSAQRLSPTAVELQFKKEAPILMEREKVEMGFYTGRDFCVFTDRRFVTIDMQGVFGKRVEFVSLPWRSFAGFSVATTGADLTRDMELRLYTNIASFGLVYQDFRKSPVDVDAIQRIVAKKILGKDEAPLTGFDCKKGDIDPKAEWWFRDNQLPLDASELSRFYHETVSLLQNLEVVELAFKGLYVFLLQRGTNAHDTAMKLTQTYTSLSSREITLFTTKRIININPQGFKGAKMEYTSIPWKSVVVFGVKTAGAHLDNSCEAMIYTDMMYNAPLGHDEAPKPGMSCWELDFNKNHVNFLAIKKYLSARCLQQAPNTPVPPRFLLVSGDEDGLENLLSTLGDEERAINPTELETVFHTTLPLLLDEEKTFMAFKVGRDLTLFTNLRIICLDSEGWSGGRTFYRSIPYNRIGAFSAKSEGGWDCNAQIHIYTRNMWSLKKLKIDFRKGKADIIAIQKFLASVVLGNQDDVGRYLESREMGFRKTKSVDLGSFLSFVTDSSKEQDASVVDAQLHNDSPILLDDEHVARAFMAGRDMFVYTNLRVLLVDVQGLRGKKIEYKSMPWTLCKCFEIETAGHLDRDAELYLHFDIPEKPVVKHSILVNGSDIYEMQAFVCSALMFPKEP